MHNYVRCSFRCIWTYEFFRSIHNHPDQSGRNLSTLLEYTFQNVLAKSLYNMLDHLHPPAGIQAKQGSAYGVRNNRVNRFLMHDHSLAT